ncbi:hypothetical protein V6N13_085696 [Hibiscus sabdariffa]|uniref:Uncharacterized protein n=1 Tax=Hibiscus sabdariffa TaxID=183260 RepID=A0ABR2FQX2_9ROSI
MGQIEVVVKSAEEQVSCQRRILQLEDEIKTSKESENKMYVIFAALTKELEKTKISLEESRHELISLRQNLEKMDPPPPSDSLEAELQSTKHDLARATSTANMLTQEVNSLKAQLKSTRDAEENNLTALDDLASALKEVRTEANQAREELEESKAQVESLKLQLNNMEAMYNEAKNEAQTFKYISERLTLEAEEGLLEWNMKETGFVDCMKKLEDERNAALEHNTTLLESLTEAQNMYRKAMEEKEQLRDNNKKQEANYVTKEAASIAREENSRRSNKLSRKMNGSTNFEVIREWKLLFCEDQCGKNKDGKEHNKKPKQHKFSSPCLNLKFPYKVKEVEDEGKHLMNESDEEESDSELSDLLRGSIFDVAETPKSADQQARDAGFVAIDDQGEEYYHIETRHFYEENDRTSRKKKALLSRFSDLIKVRSFH